MPTLRGQAGAWLANEGFVEGAIRQAIAAEDYERVGLLISRHWCGYVFAGQTATVQRWLGVVARREVTQDAALALVKAWICALGGRREECERFLRFAEGIPHEGPLPDGTASLESGVAITQATFGFDGVQSTAEAARRAAELEPGETSPWAALVRFGLGSSLYLSGETSQARRPLEEALALTEDGQHLVRVVTLSFLSFVAEEEGHAEEADRVRARRKRWWGGYLRIGYPRLVWRPSRLAARWQNAGDLRKPRRS